MNTYNREELAQTLFEESSDALFLFDPETEQLHDVNPMGQRLCGFTRQELLRRPVTYLFRSEVQGGLNRLRHAFRKTGLFHSQEGFYLRTHQDGVWVPVNLTITRLHVRPAPLGLITARDISERREAQALLKKTEAELRRVLSSVSDCIWSADIDGTGRLTYRYISPVVEKIMGRPTEFYLSGPERWLSCLHPEDQPRMEKAARLFQAGQAINEEEYRVVWPDGTIRWVRDRVLASKGTEQGSIRLDGVARDVTERKQAEEALLASEAKYRSLIENLEQCIFLKDGDLRFLAANQPFCRSLGQPETAVVGKTDFDFYPRSLAEKYRADDRIVLTEGRPIEVEEETLLEGQPRTVRVVKTPVKDNQGRTVGVLGIFWDVTEHRLLEAQLRQAQKMEAVGHLAGGVAHDFNNLLTAILGNLSLLLANLPKEDPNREMAATAEKAAWRAAELTSRLLGFSRQRPLRPQPTQLSAVLDELVNLLRRTLDPLIRVEAESAPDLWPVLADAGQIHQVLMNLCLNARDAMPGGGRLLLETANAVLDEPYTRLHLDARPGEFVRLRVCDTGQGIPPEIRARIFEPFFTTKEPGKGNGLGLAIVFGIVKQHHGWIDCVSNVNEGTRFDIYLPRADGEAPAAAKMPRRRGTETILLADDEPMIRDLGRTILQHSGYQVLLAEDGLQALDVYQREKERIDLVILDLTMPRLSGQEAFHKLRQIDPAVRVLFASSRSDERLTQTENARILNCIGKPYRPEELTSRVRAALDKSGQNEPSLL